MKSTTLLTVIAALTAGSAIVQAHGPAHMHRESATLVDQALDTNFGGTTGHEGHDHGPVSGKNFREVVGEERKWGASLSSGWESRHVHYGVNETGNSGAYVNEVGLWAGDFVFNAWSGFGTGNEFQEWDFSIAYNLDLGAVFLLPGYNLRYMPGIVEEGHAESHGEDHAEEHGEEHAGHEESKEHSHVHKEIGNELFLVVGTNAIPYVVPSAALIWDLNNTPGAFLEFRLDGEVPVYKDVFVLEPYALLGINLGYNTRSYYGWNNFQFGVEAEWSINEVVSVFGGVNYSVAMEALQEIGQENIVWAGAGVRLAF